LAANSAQEEAPPWPNEFILTKSIKMNK